MEFTRGMLNGLVKLVSRMYPYITDVEYTSKTAKPRTSYTFTFFVDLNKLSEVYGYEIDYNYVDESSSIGWNSPAWGLHTPHTAGWYFDEMTSINDITMNDYITDILYSLFFRSEDYEYTYFKIEYKPEK
jgi:hypothetical protein